MDKEKELQNLRDTLDGIDDKLLDLLNERMKTVHKVGSKGKKWWCYLST